jgi:threonine/homoserine/homoserine lactone efflux protein
MIGHTGPVLASLLTFAGAATLVILIPGPDTLVVLRGIVVHGRRSAVLTATGVLAGLSIWATAAAFGLTALLKASHYGYLVLRVAGGVYLLYVGVQALRSRALASTIDVRRPSLVGRGFRAGLMTDLLNPKVGVFFITFLPAFIHRGEPVTGTTLAMGAMFVVETGLYFMAMLLFVRRLQTWLANERMRRRLNRATGVVLIGFGVRLAVEG